MAKKVTPMMQQYLEIKEQYKDCILFFRLGDFYEMFEDDAKIAAKILDITLTARGKGDDGIPMCGVPYHSADGYILKLCHSGKKIAICEQVSDPSLPGIVKRDVVRVVTPGTNLQDSYLSESLHSRVLGLFESKGSIFWSYGDISTGEIYYGVDKMTNIDRLLKQVEPKELVASKEVLESPLLYRSSLNFDLVKTELSSPRRPVDFLKQELQIQTLAAFDLDEHKNIGEINALALLFNYLRATQKQSLAHLQNIRRHNSQSFMLLDSTTIENLELFYTQKEGKRQGSLFNTINICTTKPGSRLLANWLVKPLSSKEKINERLDLVETFIHQSELRLSLKAMLTKVNDLSRLINKIALNHGTPRILAAIRETLTLIPELIHLLSGNLLLQEHANQLTPLTEYLELLQNALSEEPPIGISDLGIARDGYNQEIDLLRSLRKNSKDVMHSFLESEREKTGILNLKLGSNKIVGFYFEVSKGKLDLVPDYFIQKQTLTNGSRYITPELKKFEEDLMSAENKLKVLETSLCNMLFTESLKWQRELELNAAILAELDCYLALAELAIKNNYNRPTITEDQKLEINDGRHPVIEQLLNVGEFVSNNVRFSKDKHCLVLTGPNMGGKSTYLRQTALITLLAHMGSFVPATSATIPLTDRIFTRIGASDNLARGQSTFMVEMQELALILKQATDKSLLIIDEVGRGTATHDGISIAWSALEYIHSQIGANTLFATHYHELIELAEDLPKAGNLSMSISEVNQEIVFLHKVIEGGMSESYGLEVAKLAGVPTTVLELAQKRLKAFETGVTKLGTKKEHANEAQLSIFEQPSRKHQKLISLLSETDPNRLTPLEAINRLAELKAELKDD